MSFFRAISVAAIMVGLLLLYRVHPVAGWCTLATLAAGTVFAGRRRKVHAS